MTIAGIEFESSQVQELEYRNPEKEQYRAISQNGTGRKAVTLSYTHKYLLKLQSISRKKYIDLYHALLTADDGDNGQITVDVEGEIRTGIVHIPNDVTMPLTMVFDFDITSISPEPYGEYCNMSIPLSVYEAV